MNDKMSQRRARLNQAGMVSIMVTLIMMIVITLIVLGFAQVSRRNSREALDRQLSSQAYYAAESGVNDALTLIRSGAVNDLTSNVNYNRNCTGAGILSIMGRLQAAGISNTINAANSTSYSCVLVNSAPLSSLVVPVTQTNSQVLPLNVSGPIGSLTFVWRTSGSSVSGCPATTTSGAVFKTAPIWNSGCPYGVLRLDLADTSGNAFDSATLSSKTVSVFLVPTTGSTSVTTVNLGSGPYVIAANCTPARCTASIKPNNADLKFGVRLSGIYSDPGGVTISGKDTGGADETFADSQAIIDVTGKAQDELRRIQVRVRLSGGAGSNTPSDAMQGIVCKRFTTLAQPSSKANEGDDSNIPTQICSP